MINSELTFFSCSGVVFSTLFSLTSFLSSTGCGVDSLLSLDDFDKDEGVSGAFSVSCDCTETVSSSKSSGIAALRDSCKSHLLLVRMLSTLAFCWKRNENFDKNRIDERKKMSKGKTFVYESRRLIQMFHFSDDAMHKQHFSATKLKVNKHQFTFFFVRSICVRLSYMFFL